MCYPKPGPRCSGHVKQQLADAQERKMSYVNQGDFEGAMMMSSRTSELRQQWYATPDGIRTLRENGDIEAADTFARERKEAIAAWKRENESGPQKVRHLDVAAGMFFMKDFTVLAVDTHKVPNGDKVTSSNAEVAVPVGDSIVIDGSPWKNAGGGRWETPHMSLSTEELFDGSNDKVGYFGGKDAPLSAGMHDEHTLILRTEDGREVHTDVIEGGGNDRWIHSIRNGDKMKMTGVAKYHVFTDDENYTEATHMRPYKEEPSETFLAG